MKLVKFKNKAINLLKLQLRLMESGEISWSMGNQFDETKINSSLENIENEEMLRKAYDGLHDNLRDANQLYNFLSTFDEPELDSGWVD